MNYAHARIQAKACLGMDATELPVIQAFTGTPRQSMIEYAAMIRAGRQTDRPKRGIRRKRERLYASQVRRWQKRNNTTRQPSHRDWLAEA